MNEHDEIERRAAEVGLHTAERYPTHADVGREWSWWHVEKRRWRRVELLEVPEGNPQRVKVQHLDPDMNARAVWSPIGRCRMPWEERDVYIESAERWSRAVHHPFDRDERDAAQDVFLATAPEDVAFLGFKPGGTLQLVDPAELSVMTGIPVVEILGHPDTYRDADGWLIPWPVTRRLASALARRDPLRFLRAIAAEERSIRPGIDEFIEREIAAGNADLRWVTDDEKENAARRSYERSQGKHTVLLRWIGGERASMAQEYRRLRGQYRELAALATAALPMLRTRRMNSADALADRIEHAITAVQKLPDAGDGFSSPDPASHPGR